MTLRWNCEEDGCYKLMIPDWHILDGCFTGTTVKPCDVDGQVEQGKHILQLDQKLGGGISDPAARTRNTLAERGDASIFYWVLSKDEKEVVTHLSAVGLPGWPEAKTPADLSDLRQAVYEWWRRHYARGHELNPTCPPWKGWPR